MRLLLPLLFPVLLGAAEPEIIKLWPEGAPGQMLPAAPDPGAKPNPSVVTGITEPTLTLFRPKQPGGTAVIVAPGGGFRFLSIKNEGSQVCAWLNSIGVTGALLTYRTPTNAESVPYDKPVADARKALEILRGRAAELGLERVGVLGFSAGGNLAGHFSFDRGSAVSAARPDFMVMIYGGGFLDKDDKSRFREGFSVPPDAPPAFFLVAHDDKSNPVEAAMLYLEYKKLNLPAELHIYTHGGHGFGMRRDGHPINDWPDRCAEWMAAQKWTKGQ